MLPQINGLGTLTREPEQKYTQGGASIVSFSLAFNEKFKKQDGTQSENVTFVECVVFGALGEKVVMPYVNKGDKIYISGKLKLNQWEDQNGNNRSKHLISINSIEMVGCKPQTQQSHQQQDNNSGQHKQPPQTKQYQNQQAVPPQVDIYDEDIPFAPIKGLLC